MPRVGASMLLLALAAGCGGALSSTPNEGGDSGTDGGAVSPDGDDGLGTGAGWTQCAAPSGDQLCGREQTACACGSDPSSCIGKAGCFCEGADSLGLGQPSDISICETQDASASNFYTCPDGDVMLMAPTSLWRKPGDANSCAPLDFGTLYAKNGWAKAVRYADWAPFTGDPLPSPTDCPSLPGIQLCGGACPGSCPNGYTCTGRSPLHPYSVCMPLVPATVSPNCGSGGPSNGWGCFAFKLPNATDQAIAQGAYDCVPGDWCQAAATAFPGGGILLHPQPRPVVLPVRVALVVALTVGLAGCNSPSRPAPAPTCSPVLVGTGDLRA